MVWHRMTMLCAATALLAGCATSGSRQDTARLQAQIGILDERVSQLERSSGGITTAALPSEAAAQAATANPVVASASGGSTGKVSIKPSTREIQQALKNAGFYQGQVDGKLGQQTRDAVKEFQRVHGLKDDGVVGKQTWNKLSSYATLNAKPGELDAAEVLK